MRRNLLLAALALLAFGMSGCIIIDAAKVQSCTPTTIRSEEYMIRQGPGVGSSAITPESRVPGTVPAR